MKFEKSFNAIEKHIIHSDFRISFSRFFQNMEWDKEKFGRLENSVKVAFTFDDPSLLDKCQFVCKISLNEKTEAKYFGVAYAPASNQDRLENWAIRFSDAKVFSYEGSFIRKVNV